MKQPIEKNSLTNLTKNPSKVIKAKKLTALLVAKAMIAGMTLTGFSTTAFADGSFYSSAGYISDTENSAIYETSSAVASSMLSDGGIVSLDMRQVELRDLLSALAIKMNATIFLVDNADKKVDFKADNISARQALNLITQREGLHYIEQGNIIIIGTSGKLHQSFFNQMYLTRFDTVFISSDRVKSLMGQLGITAKSITIDSNSNAIWVQGTVQELQKVRELIRAVDRIENEDNDEEFTLEYRVLTMTQVPPLRAVELLWSMGLQTQYFVLLDNSVLIFDKALIDLWEQIQAVMADLDTIAAREHITFSYQLRHIVAGDAKDWLGEAFGFGGDVNIITHNLDRFGKEIVVVCPPYLETQVRSALGSIDQSRPKVSVPVTSSSNHSALNAMRTLLSQMSGVSVGSFQISRDIGGEGSPNYVLWVEESPDKIQLIKDLVDEM
ncbi:energy transducer TonB [Heliorestis acidaminivorans]|uniref:Energy transducer TonB n=1 Tax=Heliorestis acidaminivorans TaxID=553427 RepID=A0A6I0ERL2_9FIRM|nr:energy transducer TonB [Heliorestis acidaminivorans]KAB2951316.1 energy transducer TonB [Heliorestis acidaminivorans]